MSPTYQGTIREWWVLMHGHPPLSDEIEEFRACYDAWEKHPDPKAQCECGHINRLWSGTHIACANPRCDKWGKTHDGQEILDLHNNPTTDILREIREGVKRSTN